MPDITSSAKKRLLNPKAVPFFPSWLNTTVTDALALLRSLPSVQSETNRSIKVKQLINHITTIDPEQLCAIISSQFCKELLVQFDDFQTPVQRELLHLCCSVAQRGAEMVEQWKENKFAKQMADSGLIVKICTCTVLELKKWRNFGSRSDLISDFLIQLVLTYSFMQKATELGDEKQQLLSTFYKAHLLAYHDCLLKEIKKSELKRRQIPITQFSEKDEEIETKLQIVSQSLKALSCITETEVVQHCFVKEFEIHEVVAPLIHISCSPEIRCSQRLQTEIIKNNQTSQEFLSTVYKALAELTWQKEYVK
ncbi:MAG: hypothetical protein EZS28_038122 [Streblomastix strix]|uniref:Uncharacterized protein n=1 Tax=Streblomastix strix TaxID=222440 RepID=A0A5J4U816_9EUKA|nr:MAG: hypothetical protein EZS28_038122 [Streblomastix strix]